MVWQRECLPGSCQNDLQFQFLILLHYLLKAQEDCECAQVLWSMLDWRSRVLLWSFFSKLRALPGPLSSLEITPCIFLPPHSSHSSPVKSVPSASVATNSLCFLLGKHVLVILCGNSSHFATGGCAKRDWLRITYPAACQTSYTLALKMQSVTRTPLFTSLSPL